MPAGCDLGGQCRAWTRCICSRWVVPPSQGAADCPVPPSLQYGPRVAPGRRGLGHRNLTWGLCVHRPPSLCSKPFPRCWKSAATSQRPFLSFRFSFPSSSLSASLPRDGSSPAPGPGAGPAERGLLGPEQLPSGETLTRTKGNTKKDLQKLFKYSERDSWWPALSASFLNFILK